MQIAVLHWSTSVGFSTPVYLGRFAVLASAWEIARRCGVLRAVRETAHGEAMNQLTFDQAEGQRLQREGQETVAAKNGEWLTRMRCYARMHCRLYGQVTTDDVRCHAAGLGAYPTHHNIWGVVFKQKGWTVIGRQPSKLPGNRAREIKVWKWEGI